jgi:hypothetical protein
MGTKRVIKRTAEIAAIITGMPVFGTIFLAMTLGM